MALTRLGLNQSINLATNTTGNLNLASQVTGTLATGNGGTGATSFTSGKVLQVLQNDQQSQISSSSNGYAICTQAITPSATSSKILIHAFCTGYTTSTSGCGVNVTSEISGGGQNSVLTFNSIGSRRGVFGGQAYMGNSNDKTELMGGSFLHSPNTTSAVTYRLNTTIETGTFYINRTPTDSDNGHYVRSVTRMIVMEIGA
jgi:hypothetical protein